MSEARLLTRKQIRARGWTADMMQRMLPPADQTRENPFNVHARPVKLYFLRTITEIELSEPFKRAMEGAANRKAGARAALSRQPGAL